MSGPRTRTPTHDRRFRASIELRKAVVAYGKALAVNGIEPEIGCAILYNKGGHFAPHERVKPARDALQKALERYVRVYRGARPVTP